MIAVLVTSTEPPVTIPVGPTLAIPDALLLHVPPAVISLKDVVKPAHTVSVPNMAVGNGLTVTTCVSAQLPIVYEIVVVPADRPVTLPSASTVPTKVFTLVHIPPPVASVKVVVNRSHTDVDPVI